MKRILLFLSALFIATTAIAHTINWHIDGNIFHTTTCESGENVTPPTAPEKYGYTFRGWVSEVVFVEYITSTGTNYINTLIKPFNYLGIETKFQMLSSADVDWFGTMDSLLVWDIDSARNHIYVRYGHTSSKQLMFAAGYNNADFNFLDKPHLLKIESGNDNPKIFIDNTWVASVPVSNSDFSNSTSYITISAARNTSSAKWYSFKILDNDGYALFYGRPAIDRNGIAGMYDLVTRKMFYASGTGDFIAGPIVGE